MRAPASVREFYDELADEYHLIYADWANAVRRQGAVLDRLIRSSLGDGPAAVLDCACGIGTQAIGLALRGHRVTATDVSERSVDRARREAASFAVDVAFAVADFRDLGRVVDGTYDVVLACDNSLPHLVSDEDLAAAAASMLGRLRPGGLLIASIRDYEEAIQSRRRTTTPQVFDGPEGRRVVFQVWDWAPDQRTYDARLLILRDEEDAWSVRSRSTTYRALGRGELAAVLADAGASQVRWHTPGESGYFQPIVTARAGAGSGGGPVL